ncbi:MAG: hypothetical protein HY342_09330 [Candidatus Lambdaproteobacteria bacterium]|nr:hypothetical protein [Candidatus Lambdaproteobacteria bacterium]
MAKLPTPSPATAARHLLAAVAVVVLACAAGPAAAQAPAGGDPFGQSQLADPIVAGAAGTGAPLLTVSGFLDVGAVLITQSGPKATGGDLSWAFGNSQFTFFSQSQTFTVNELDLNFDAQREQGNVLYAARASIDFYPSRDSEAYSVAATDREFDVDEAFVSATLRHLGHTRIVLGRAPGFVTLEQQEGDAPEARLIGHSYVYLAGGGYPFGLQVIAWPVQAVALKFGMANGGLGAYSFYPGDNSTLNRPVARDDDRKSTADRLNAKTVYAAAEWTAFDRPAETGTLRLGLAAAQNPGLTWNALAARAEPYAFSNLYVAYRFGAFEVRSEAATFSAYFETGLGAFEASLWTALLSWYVDASHLLTLRAEGIAFKSDRDAAVAGTGSKAGLSYRWRLADGVVLKAEALRETQTPQYWQPTLGEALTTDVLAASWVYAF